MKNLKRWGMGIIAYLLCIGGVMSNTEASTLTAGKTHIGTFNGSTTFRTSSSNGINPGLFIEVRDAAGNLKQYTSDDGVVTVENTKEGAYVTQAKLLGKTKYVDQETGEVLDQWEAGRNLKLESSKMPVLTTTGKNLLTGLTETPNTTYTFDKGVLTTSKHGAWGRYGIEWHLNLKKDVSYYFHCDLISGNYRTNLYKKDGTLVGNDFGTNLSYSYYTVPEDGEYIFVVGSDRNNVEVVISNLQLTTEKTKTPYEPPKTNILTTSEEVTLRGIGNVKDELNLLTGELTTRVGEYEINATAHKGSFNDSSEKTIYFFVNQMYLLSIPKVNAPLISNSVIQPILNDLSPLDVEGVHFTSGGHLQVRIDKSRLSGTSSSEVSNYLRENPITIQYQVATESVKTVDLTTTHQFDVISDAFVQVKGDVLPTIYSVTVPSEPLTFAINPNGEEGQQFIAPDFKITNESKGPVFLELKSFQQVTNVFNDVSPDKYENWSYLTKDESRDIALALVPMKSEGWLTLNEGLKYVSTTENIELGSIKPGGTVDFSFSAYHGRVFDQNLFPEYRLVFTFGF